MKADPGDISSEDDLAVSDEDESAGKKQIMKQSEVKMEAPKKASIKKDAEPARRSSRRRN